MSFLSSPVGIPEDEVIVIQNGENFDSRVLVDIIINLVPKALFRQAKAPWGRG